MQSDRDLLRQALGYMESVGQMDMHPEEWAIAVALRERLAQPEFDSALQSAAMTQTAAKLAQPEQKRPQNCGTSYCSCIECVMEPEQPEQSPLDRMAENARELGLDYEPVQEPEAHSIVAGALFDFMGWLTTRRERLVLSSTDDAAPAADAIKDFANMRGLLINGAQVQEWQEHLTTPPNCPNCARLEAQNTELDAKLAETEQEPVAWRDHVEQRLLTWRQSFVNRSGDQLALDDFMDKESLDDLIDYVCDEYTTPPRREWVGLTLDDMEELAVSKEWLAGTRWAEAKLKEKNDA